MAAQEALSDSGGRVLSDPAGRPRRFAKSFSGGSNHRHRGSAGDDAWRQRRGSLERRPSLNCSTACDGFLARDVDRLVTNEDEKLEMMRGMVLMRALDNRLKQFYLQGDVKYGSIGVQGKGFRSLGPGSDLRRRHPASPRVRRIATAKAAGTATSSAR